MTGPVEDRLNDLLTQWRELHRQGHDPTPEDLCCEFPELVSELRSLIDALHSGVPPVTKNAAGSGSTAAHETAPRSIGEYEIQGEIGHGGMGVVYRAFDRSLPRRCGSTKKMQVADPVTLHRFKQEFRTLADVAHPNLVSLHELISDGEDWFIVMEFVEGVKFPGTFVQARRINVVRFSGDDGRQRLGRINDRERAAGRDLNSSKPPQLHAQRRCERPGAAPACKSSSGSSATGRGSGSIASGRLSAPRPQAFKCARRPPWSSRDPRFRLDRRTGPDRASSELRGSRAGNRWLHGRPSRPPACLCQSPSDWYGVRTSCCTRSLTGRLPFPGPKRLEVLMDKQQFDAPSPCANSCQTSRTISPHCALTWSGGIPTLVHLEAKYCAGWGVRLVIPENQTSSKLPAAPLIGRDRHLEDLEAAFATMTHGQTIAFLIQGRSGTGKTALAQRFLEGLVRRDQGVVLAGRLPTIEREAVFPYKALDSLIDGLGRYLNGLSPLNAQSLLPRDIWALVQVFPVLRRIATASAQRRHPVETPDPQELRRRAFVALRELLARLGDFRPLVLFIDDVQWSDIDSASLITELLRPPDPPVLMLLGCSRSEDVETSPLLPVFRGTREVEESRLERRELAIAALTRTESESLALSLLGRSDPAMTAHAGAIAVESSGNPLFIYELVRHFQSGGEPTDTTRATGRVALEEVLLTRICHLPDDSRRLLEVIAVSGRPIGESEACRAAEVVQDQRAAAAILRSGRLIRSTSPLERGGIEIYHDRIRETVVAHLEPRILQSHHLRLAMALEGSSWSDPEVLAIHFDGAKEYQRAGEYFAKAADQASHMLAFERAVKLFRLALASPLVDSAEAYRLRIQIGDALAHAGRGSEAALEYLAAIPDANAAEKLELRRRAALQYLISGRGRRAVGPRHCLE